MTIWVRLDQESTLSISRCIMLVPAFLMISYNVQSSTNLWSSSGDLRSSPVSSSRVLLGVEPYVVEYIRTKVGSLRHTSIRTGPVRKHITDLDLLLPVHQEWVNPAKNNRWSSYSTLSFLITVRWSNVVRGLRIVYEDNSDDISFTNETNSNLLWYSSKAMLTQTRRTAVLCM